MTKLTNKTRGPKSVNTTTGPHILNPGESADLDVADAELKAMKETGFLDPSTATTGAASIPDPDQERFESDVKLLKESGTEEQLRKVAEDEGISLDDEVKTKQEVAEAIIRHRQAQG